MARSRRGVCIVWILLWSTCFSFGQSVSNRYAVFFTDKSGTPFSILNPASFLSQKAIDRRNKHNIAVIEDDLPVNPAYVSSVVATGARVLYTTKWLNAVIVEATSSQLTDINNLSFVDNTRTEYVAKDKTGYTGGRIRSVNKFESAEASSASAAQNSLLGLDIMHSEGITGNGVTIAILDTGFPGALTNLAFSAIISSNRIKDAHNFAMVTNNPFVGDSHGARVFSIIGSELSSFQGGAFDANFLLYATEFVDNEFKIEEYNWLSAAERADSAGADVISSSLGYTDFDDSSMDYTHADLDGKTAIITRAAEIAFNRGIVVVNSAGNYGSSPWTLIAPPADGNDVIAVGSINIDLQHSSFSSTGPTADDRIKPDVVALGNPASTILPNGSIGSGSGTSFACPMITSLVAGVMQHWPELTAPQVVQLIRTIASQSFHPDNLKGYGIPTYQAVKNFFELPSSTDPILVYPNPADEVLKVAQSKPDGTPTKIQVYSILGQPIMNVEYESTWQNNPAKLDFSSIAPGLYIVKVENKGSLKSFRIIKR